MRHLLSAIALAVIVTVSVTAQTDIVTQLGSSNEEARDSIFSSLSSGSVQIPGVSGVFKTAGASARVAMVTAVMKLARAYTGTDDFAKRWAMYREDSKPEMRGGGPATAADIDAEMRKGLEEAIRAMESTAKQMPQMRKELEAQIAEMRKQLASVGKGGDTAQLDAALKQNAQAQADDVAQQIAQWEKDYPADPKAMVARRLREFLALSATVDYSAALTKRDGRMVFVNPEYERKDAHWKYLYRAGKPAVDAARSLAQEWLKGLGG